MADLLSRLADRTLGRGAAVQPRVAPLFAAERAPSMPQVLASEPGAVWDGLSVSRARSAAPSALDPSTGLAEESASAGIPQGMTEFAEHLATPLTTVNRPPGRRQSVSLAESKPPPVAVGIEEAPPVATLASPLTMSSPRLPPPLVRPPAGSDAVAMPLLENPAELRPVDTPRPDPSLVSSRAAAVRRASPASQPTVAGIHRQIAGEEKVPAVQVTIGRIDVRAVLPDPPPARPAARPEPRLTLEEYSRQRREGLR